MQSSIPRKSSAQKARLRSRRAVRRHGDHTSRCMVWRHGENGSVKLGRFRGVSKYQRVGTREQEERIKADPLQQVPGVDAEGVYHSETDDSVSYIEGVPVYSA